MNSKNRPPFWPITLKLRAKVTLGVVLPLLFILGVFTLIEYIRHRNVLLSNLSALASYSGQVIESNLRYQMLDSDFKGIQELLDVIGTNEGFRAVYLLDTSGQVIFSPGRESEKPKLDNQKQDCQPCHQLPPEERPESIVVRASDGKQVFRSMQPIENSSECAQCHDPDERLLGLLLTDILIEPFEGFLFEDLRENFLWWSGTILITVLVVNLVINRFVLRRLEALVAAIANFGQGVLPTQPGKQDSDEIGQIIGAFNAMAYQVEARNVENLELSSKLSKRNRQRGDLLKRLITAQEDERKRVARELHDELGQILGGLSFRIDALERFIRKDPDRAMEQVSKTRTIIHEISNRVYELIYSLRPSALDDLGLPTAIRAHARRQLNKTGITFELNDDGLTDRLPRELETALYRTYQEALNNVIRHAHASKVELTLSRNNGMFVGEFIDDGCGFDMDKVQMDGGNHRGLGLLGMQERVSQCGGQLEVDSQSGKGTRISIRVNLAENYCD